jgi:dihydrolipoamide dehydrogenase
MEYDIAIIGGGPAGYSAALKGVQIGASVVLFEGNKLGGTCLNVGCIPTKCYVSKAELIERIKKNTKNGIFKHAGLFSFKKIYEEKEKVVNKLTAGVAVLLKAAGVTVIRENAKIKNAKSLIAGGQEYKAKKIIIATGSKNMKLSIPGIDSENVLDSTGILALNKLPKSLVIIGAGVIGLEIACVMNAFGCEVTAVDILTKILPSEDSEGVSALYASLKNSGIKFKLGHKVVKIEDAEGEKLTTIEKEGKIESIFSEYVLVGVGRVPVSVVAEDIGMQKDEKNFIVTDDYMETSIPGIFAAGDVVGGYLLAHSAYVEAETAVYNCMQKKKKVRLEIVPRCIFTIPSLSAVGMTEEQAKKICEVTKGNFPFAASGKALASGATEGFVKWIADKKTGKLLGCTIVGGEGTEMICAAVIALNNDATVTDFESMIFPHPTLSESVKEAVLDNIGEALHIPKR